MQVSGDPHRHIYPRLPEGHSSKAASGFELKELEEEKERETAENTYFSEQINLAHCVVSKSMVPHY